MLSNNADPDKTASIGAGNACELGIYREGVMLQSS